ncbi:MAG: hypothetical protein WCO56_10445 [Verrucomicrobiota bacterium]
MHEQRRAMESLQQQIEVLKAQAASPTASRPASPPPVVSEPPLLWEKKGALTDGIRVQSGRAYMDIGLVGDLVMGISTAKDIEGHLQQDGHDPSQRGFTLQGLEANFTGAVDPYFRGNANVAFQINSAGDSALELEEAWLETTSLPGNLQLRLGQYLTDFGRANTTHPHTWSFVDSPLVSARLLGPDGVRNLGARLSWLVPTPFYSELFLGMQNSHGSTAYSFRYDHGNQVYLGRPNLSRNVNTLGDMLFSPRYTASFDIADRQTLVLGISGAFGPNASGQDGYTRIYGADLYWKWKSSHQDAGFPFVSFQTETIWRQYHASVYSNAADDLNHSGAIDGTERNVFGDSTVRTLPGETLLDYGLYSQISWGFTKGWVVALRGDWVNSSMSRYESMYGRDPERAARWRISPNLTWFPTEFSKIRLQYNYDERALLDNAHSIWLQFEFLLGAHGAHKF